MNSIIEIANGLASQWLAGMWTVVWQSATLAAIVYLLTLCIRRAPAAVRFWLWMLVPLRLLLMPLITIGLPLLPAVTQPESTYIEPTPPVEVGTRSHSGIIPPESEPSTVEFRPMATQIQNAELARRHTRPNAQTFLMSLWLAGVSLCSVRLLLSLRRIRRIAAGSTAASDTKIHATAQKAATMLKLKQMPRIMVTDRDISPFLSGVLRPVLVAPARLIAEVNEEGLYAVFAHEFAHLRRRDPLIGWVLAICEAVYFFHPILHFAKRRILLEREQACDNWVVASSRAKRSIYANALISAADACRGFSAKVGPVGAVAESFGDLKKRLLAINRNLKPKARLSASALILLVIVGAICVPGIVLTARPASTDEPATLEKVRELVARNEALINPIKMSYTVKLSQTHELQRPAGGGRRVGRRTSHRNTVWAQSGPSQYIETSSFYSPDELARSSVIVFDDKVKIQGNLPDLMEGHISARDRRDWFRVLTAKLRLRPFEGRHLLSDILVPEYATLHGKMETVDGRQTYVVDADRPDGYPSFARLWIDAEAGVPLRTHVFGKHPTVPDAEAICEVDDISLHRLGNGGWIPIAGTRAIHSRRSNPPYAAYEHISVDVKSITTRRQDIPESLFRIEFPEGACIRDAISGLTSVRGRQLKTYEQVVNGTGRFIAGTVVDINNVPVPDVVVGPFAVKYLNSEGRSNLKLTQGRDRTCVTTDSRGRFAVELEQEGSYDLLFLSNDFVDKRLRDIPLDKHDLKVSLSKGGTVTGHVVRLVDGREVPAANVEVEAKEAARIPSLKLRPGRLRTITDSQGEFQIKYLAAKTRKRGSPNQQEPQDVPVIWEIRCGATSQTIQFDDGIDTREVELVLKPHPSAAASLVGRQMPGLEELGIAYLRGDLKNRKVLLCFFDMDQRPSRNYVLELAQQAKQLEQRGVAIAAVQVSKVRPSELDEWVKRNNIDVPVGMIEGDAEQVLFRWGVRARPWLVWISRNHVVTSEGFGIEELDEKINKLTPKAEERKDTLPEDTREPQHINEDMARILSDPKASRFQMTWHADINLFLGH